MRDQYLCGALKMPFACVAALAQMKYPMLREFRWLQLCRNLVKTAQHHELNHWMKTSVSQFMLSDFLSSNMVKIFLLWKMKWMPKFNFCQPMNYMSRNQPTLSEDIVDFCSVCIFSSSLYAVDFTKFLVIDYLLFDVL